MGDTPLQPGALAEFQRQDAPTGAFQATGQIAVESSPAFAPPYPQQQHSSPPQHAFSSQLDMAQPHGSFRGGPPFDMTAMANALPQHGYMPAGPYGQGQPRYNTIAMSSPVPQFGAQGAIAPAPGQQYYLQQHAHMAHYYQTPLSPQVPTSLPARTDLGYYPNTAVVNQQPHPAAQYYYPQPAHFPGQMYAVAGPQHGDPRQPQLQPSQVANPVSPVDLGKGMSEGRHDVVRGPPRKPKQSGHAIWIGNLPPQADLMNLVHHVCKEAEGLESLFLISKSNCAFANFRDEQASIAAQRKLHDSKFMTVRLVSRLRKSTVEGPAGITAPTGPAASAPQPDAAAEPVGGGEDESGGGKTDASAAVVTSTVVSAPSLEDAGGPGVGSPVEGGPLLKDRFFILKSLTVEDIELSVRTNIWATQSHNEESLNSAFKNADNVYLIFSANKSGEYFGFARMVSPINNDPEAAIEFAPKVQSASDVDLPKAIPTEATEFAPKGRIIDDSARGTIFWEAEGDDQTPSSGGTDEDGSGGGSVSGGDTGSVKSGQEGAGGEPKAWGKPFRLEWLSTARLPFYRTRGLRNPWNSNREVKIARDGTELEPSVGRRLIGLFNRAQSPALAVVPGIVPGTAVPGGPRGHVAVTPFPPMRQSFQPQ